MSNTRELARKSQNPFEDYPTRNRGSDFDPKEYYSDYDYFNSTIHEIRKETNEELYKSFKKDRPRAALFLESLFGDMAKEVFSFFPPDMGETRCGALLALMTPPKEIDESRAINSLGSHIEEL